MKGIAVMNWEFNGDGAWSARSRHSPDVFGLSCWWIISVCRDGSFTASRSSEYLMNWEQYNTDLFQKFESLRAAARFCEWVELVRFPSVNPPVDAPESA